MHLTENEIEAFILTFMLGAAAGSIVTYCITTREKRIIADVRRRINYVGTLLTARNQLTHSQYRKTIYPNAELVSDKRILEVYDWAKRVKKAMKLKTASIHLTALVILCEELLGLSARDAVQASKTENPDDLCALLRPNAPTEKKQAAT